MTQLAPHRFKQSEVVRNQWNAQPEHATPMEAMLEPGYWAHVSAMLNVGDHIYALSLDKTWHAAFLVIDAGKLYAKVVPIPGLCFEIKQAQIFDLEIPAGYEIPFRGETLKWCVVRGKDVLKEGLEKREAELWLKEHLATIGVTSTKKAAKAA